MLNECLLHMQGPAAEIHRAMADELEELHHAIAERDQELLGLNRELSDLADRLPVRSPPA